MDIGAILSRVIEQDATLLKDSASPFDHIFADISLVRQNCHDFVNTTVSEMLFICLLIVYEACSSSI